MPFNLERPPEKIFADLTLNQQYICMQFVFSKWQTGTYIDSIISVAVEEGYSDIRDILDQLIKIGVVTEDKHKEFTKEYLETREERYTLIAAKPKRELNDEEKKFLFEYNINKDAHEVKLEFERPKYRLFSQAFFAYVDTLWED